MWPSQNTWTLTGFKKALEFLLFSLCFLQKITFVYTLPTQFLKALLWLIVLCLVFKCAKISEFLKYFEILVITNSFWAETCLGEKTWIGFLEKWTLCKSTNAHRGTKSFLKIQFFQPFCFLRLCTLLLAHLPVKSAPWEVIWRVPCKIYPDFYRSWDRVASTLIFFRVAAWKKLGVILLN